MFEGRDWAAVAGASDECLDRLRSAFPVPLPDGLFRLLAFSNGGEGPVSDLPCYIYLYPVDEIIEMKSKYPHLPTNYPGFIFFGSSGGGSWVALDTREGPPYKIVVTDLIAPPEMAIEVAPDFDAFLEMMGYEDEVGQEELRRLRNIPFRDLKDD
jgi:hypothetical protein